MALYREVTCPFCGLLCDDLSVSVDGDTLAADSKGCPRAERGYHAALAADAAPRISGQTVDLDTAVARAAKLLAGAEAPLFGGLAGDVNAARATLDLAERVGAGVDHANGLALLRNVRVVQRDGWVTTTFAELRNRADLVILFGTRLFELFPRLTERLLLPGSEHEQTLHPDRLARRRFWLLGRWRELPQPLAERAEIIDLAADRLAEFSGALRALVSGRQLDAASIAGVPVARLRALAGALHGAEYSVLVWSAGDLGPPPQATLAVDQLAALSRELNRERRAAGLPLAGSNGDITFNQVCTWRYGIPLPGGFGGGAPVHDPAGFARPRGAYDVLLWLASLDHELAPPPDAQRVILLGHPRLQTAATPAVSIPVGIPGIDHSGHLYRGDAVVSLPLKRLRDSGPPAAAEVLRRINARLGPRPC